MFLHRPDTRPTATARLCLALAIGFGLALAAGDSAAESAAIPDKGRDVARASFDRFAQGWMEKMHGLEAANRRQTGAAGFRGYGREYRTELKPTGYARAPYVGVLRYEEHEYRCEDAAASRCSVASTTPVTEIFRFQDGRWVY